MVVDPSLEQVRESAFLLHSSTGVLTLNMQPNDGMDGAFEFDVVATDPGEFCIKFLVNGYLFRDFFLFFLQNCVYSINKCYNFSW